MDVQYTVSWSALIAVLLGAGILAWLIRAALSRRSDGSRSATSLIAITILPLLILGLFIGAPAVTYLQLNQSPNVSQMARTATSNSMETQPQSNVMTEGTIEELKRQRADLEEQIRSDDQVRDPYQDDLAELDRQIDELERSIENYPSWLKENDPFRGEDASHAVVSSERFTSVEESRQAALLQVRSEVTSRIRRDFAGFQSNEPLTLSDEDLESFVIDEHIETFNLKLTTQEIEAEMFRTHLLLDLSHEQFAQLLPEIREETIDTRIRLAGIALLAVVGISGLIGLGTRQLTRSSHTG